jgi:hypothetical protein
LDVKYSVPLAAAVILQILTLLPNTNGLAWLPFPVAATDTEIGGALDGVVLLLAAVYGPAPTALTAATRKTYAVPFVSPVTVALVVADEALENVVHVVPLFIEYCTL